MENFEEYLNSQRHVLQSEKLRLQYSNNVKDEQGNELINEDGYLNDKIEKQYNDEIVGNFIYKNNETKSNSENIKVVEKCTIHDDDLNNFAKQGILELPQLSSYNFNQSDLNTNNSINTSDCNDSSSNEKEHKKINVNFIKESDIEGGNSKGSVEFVKDNDDSIQEKTFRSSKQNNWTRRSKNDDMEQWISDTFYSYFPSLNSEQIKRENNNRARQLDYQNYLKKISNVEQTDKNRKADEQNSNYAQTIRNVDKSEMEIIVTTNPNYENPSKYRDNYYQTPLRPSSTRDKLLQDLKHTELSNMIYGDAVQIRKQAEIEREMEKKKEYQQDLMRQIEEKRREIELLKEKERIDEQTLTRKLEEQLRTVKLQEELEKEKIKTERTRFEIERNKIIREQLLSKLENDKLRVKSPESNFRETKSENDEDISLDSALKAKSKNEVYRFFTNSARQDYRKPIHHQSLTDAFEEFANISAEKEQFLLDPTNFKAIERRGSLPSSSIDCTHLNRKICPFCEVKLKNYESCCPYCKQQILDDGAENRTMLCENCENQYLICSACDKKKIICEFCHRKRNICASCTRNFCVHCGNSINLYKNKNKAKASKNNLENVKNSRTSEHSFQILELPNNENHDTPINSFRQSNFSSPEKTTKFSTNYSKNSIFNTENKNSDSPFFEFGVRNGEIVINNRIYNNTSNRFLNEKTSARVKAKSEKIEYSKTKPKLNNGNISLNEMPLLSEIPKKSNLKNKNETKKRIFREDKSTNSSIEDLSRKWEVPAVEKRTISTHSPIVLTQLGAVRRQLQIDRLQAELMN